MASTQVQYRRGTTSENNVFTGALAEITVDTTNNTLRVHDGATAGGFATVGLTQTQTLTNKTLSGVTVTGNVIGNLIPSANVTYNLGSASQAWNNLYLAGNTLYLGSLQLKDIGSNTFAVFTSDGVTQANLDVGAIDVSAISQGSSLIGISGTNGNAYITVNNAANVLVVSSAGATVNGIFSATGNVNAQNIIANSLVSTAQLVTSGNATIGGDLFVNGNVTYINVETLAIEDPMISVGGGANGTSLSSDDGKTRGTLMYYYNGAQLSAFVGLDDTTRKIVLASNVSVANGVVSVNSYGNAVVGNIEGVSVSVTGNITGGNVLTGGLISTTGNIVGNNASFTTDLVVPAITGSNISAPLYISSAQTGASAIHLRASNVRIGNGVSAGTLVSKDATDLVLTTNEGNIGQGTITISNGSNGNITLTPNGTGQVVMPTVTSTGNITGGNILTGGVVSATATITGGNLTTGGAVSATGNITGGNLTTGGTANIGTLIVSGTQSITGNITGGNILTGGLISATATITGGNLATGGTASAGGNITGGNILTGGLISATATITGGNLATGGTTSAGGNITGGNILTGGLISATSTITSAANITGGNILTGGLISATSTITGGNLATGGTASVTGNVTGGNILTGGLISATSTITSAANITGGNILTGGSVSATGNLTGGGVSATGNITGGNLSGTNIAGTLTTAAQPNITSVGTLSLLTVTANVTGGNLLTGGLISAAGGITGASLNLGTGNITAGNLIVSGAILDSAQLDIQTTAANANIVLTPNGTGNVNIGRVSSSGNITAAAYYGSGDGLTSIPGANVTGTVPSATSATTAGTVTTAAQPNITSVGTLTALTVTGNTTSGNLLTGGLISATGNITGRNVNAGLATAPDSVLMVSPQASTQGIANALGTILHATGLDANITRITTDSFGTGVYTAYTGRHARGTAATPTQTTAGDLMSQFTARGYSNGTTGFGANSTGRLDFFAAESATDTARGTYAVIQTTANGAITPSVAVTVTESQSMSVVGNVTGANLITAGGVFANTVTGTSTTVRSTGNINLSATGNIVLSTQTYINNLASPAQDQDAATKKYVDDIAQGLNVHDSVKAATPDTLANVTGGTITYNNGASGVGATLTTTGTFNLIDTVNVQTAGTRILVKNEANAVTNGLYTWSNATAIVRATDYDSVPEVEAGDFMFITNGTLYGNTSWAQTSTVTGIGTAGNAIVFTQIGGAGVYTPGTGINITGTTISIANTVVTAGSYGNSTAIPTFTVNQQGQLTAASTAAVVAPAGTLSGSILNATVVNSSLQTVGTLTSLSVTGNTVTGNLSTVGTISATGNAVVGNVSATNYTGTTVSVTGNVTAAYFSGNGSLLSSITGANVTGTVSSATYATSAGSATTAGTVTTAAQPNITSVGTLTALTITGNTTSGNLLTSGLISATGQVTGSQFNGSGAGLSSIPGGNVTGTVPSATSATTATTAGTVTTAAQPNITSVGTLTSVAVTGNITAGNLTGATLVSATSLAGTLTTAAQTNITSVGTLTSLAVTGNISGGNISTAGNLAAPTAAQNTNTTQVATTAYVLGQASSTTPGAVGSAAVGTGSTFARADHTHSGVTSITTSSGLSTNTGATGAVSITNTGVTSIAAGTNISVSGATGAVTVSVSGTVASATTAATVTTAAQPNITSVGTLTGLTINNVTTAITNGASAGTGNIGASGAGFNTVFAKATSAQYADLAEAYVADAEYTPGTVMIFGGSAEVTMANRTGDTRIAGVVSTNPAHVMNAGLDAANVVVVALTGRVPTRVTGSVSKGDMMVAAGNGYAQACSTPSMGSVIGKALENFDGESGVIEIVVGRL